MLRPVFFSCEIKKEENPLVSTRQLTNKVVFEAMNVIRYFMHN